MSLRAVHVPGVPEPSSGLSVKTETQVRGMDAELLDGGSDLGMIWHSRGGPLWSQESTQCPLWFSLSHPTSIDALAHPWPDMKLYAYPPVKLIAAGLCRVKTCRVRFLLVVGLPSGGRSMGDSNQEIPAMSASGQNLAPMSRDMEVWPIIGCP